ncbi:MAG: GNAT family N-acetyltransferase [Terriglobia bacterium]|jgi:RimJ/RimL family protein N-acetyltransferase
MATPPEAVFQPTEVRTRKGRKLDVRAYASEDFPTLVEMYAGFEPKRVAQGLPPPDVPRITRWLQQLQKKSCQLLAFDGKKIVAHAILCPIRQPEIEFTIFVHQDYREEALGTAMSELSLAWSLEMGFSKVLLTTEFSNYRAIGLFRKLGFHTSSSYGDECEMVADLSAESKAKAA